jgi:DNA repair protein RadC
MESGERMSIHDGHRQRLMARFREEGLDHFEPVQVLELLLFFCIPRRDTNEIAHELMNRFGSLARVMDASIPELMEVPGVGQNAATFLHVAKEAGRYYQVDSVRKGDMMRDSDDCGKYLLPRFIGRQKETVFLLCLNANCNVIACREVGEGDLNAAVVSPRRVVEIALAERASTVVLAHNHPSGVALPSHEDVLVTQRLAAALRMVDVVLFDHLIVADDDYVSLVQSGLYRADDRSAYV